jgi:hypothetical protein
MAMNFVFFMIGVLTFNFIMQNWGKRNPNTGSIEPVNLFQFKPEKKRKPKIQDDDKALNSQD